MSTDALVETTSGAEIGHEPTRSSFPPQQGEASALADTYKSRVQTITKARLGILVIIAVLALLSVEFGGWRIGWLSLSVTLFALLAIGEVSVWLSRPDKHWHDARALSELVKTLGWRHAVGADPLTPGEDPQRDIEEQFISRIRDVTQPYMKALTLKLQDSSSDRMITPWMDATRNAPFEQRKAIYKAHRFKSQQNWYERKITMNDKSGKFWGGMLFALYFVGVVFACLEIAGVLDLDVLGVIGAIATSMLAWAQSQQHQNLAHEYAVTRDNLRYLEHRFKKVTEDEWSQLVNDIEREFAREHAAWQSGQRVRHWGSKPE